MTLVVQAPAAADSVEDVVRRLGGIPLGRVVLDPPPGTATEADLLRVSDRNGRPCELIDGTLVELAVGYNESLIASRLIAALVDFVEPRRLGLVSGEQGMMRLTVGRVRVPDVAYVSFDRLPGRRPPDAPVPMLSPDLMAEVLSESNTRVEIESKRRDFISTGTRLMWVLDPPARSIAVFTSIDEPDRVLHDGDTLDGGAVLPEFAVTVSRLFGPVYLPVDE